MSRRCQCPVCPETFDPEMVHNHLNWCLKCYDEYVVVMSTYRSRHAGANGKQLELLPQDAQALPT